MDNLTIALCISIGTGVPWLIATYSENGARQLLENCVFGMIGVAFGAWAFNWISSTHALVALVSLGPVVTYGAIVAGQALKRAILQRN